MGFISASVYAVSDRSVRDRRLNEIKPVIHARLPSREHLKRLEEAVVVAGSSSVADFVRQVIEREVEETLKAK